MFPRPPRYKLIHLAVADGAELTRLDHEAGKALSDIEAAVSTMFWRGEELSQTVQAILASKEEDVDDTAALMDALIALDFTDFETAAADLAAAKVVLDKTAHAVIGAEIDDAYVGVLVSGEEGVVLRGTYTWDATTRRTNAKWIVLRPS